MTGVYGARVYSGITLDPQAPAGAVKKDTWLICVYRLVVLQCQGIFGCLKGAVWCYRVEVLLLMDKILHDPKAPKLWELWYIPYNG